MLHKIDETGSNYRKLILANEAEQVSSADVFICITSLVFFFSLIFCFCFSIANCRKQLDSTNATEHDDELFCKSCYGKKFGPKGYGYGGGAGVLSMDDGTGYIVISISSLKSESQQ